MALPGRHCSPSGKKPKKIKLMFWGMTDQQAEAIIAARKKIVHGAVSMVDMALKDLAAQEVIHLDDERKATMVSNLLVVLCGESEVHPVVNTGTIYQ